MDIKKQAEQYAEKFRLEPETKGWYQQKVDDFTAGYEAALRQFTVMQQSEQLLQAYKEGFDAAVETLVGANKVVQQKRLQ